MKIRSYKGPSLDTLYEAIHDELGPDAVVVCPGRAKGIGGLLPSRRHELIAIVDDSTADAHLLSKAAGAEDIQKLSVLHAEKWNAMEELFENLREEIRGFSRNASSSVSPPGGDAGGFAQDWDPRFLRIARSEMPEIFEKGAVESEECLPERLSAGIVQAGLLRVKEGFSVKRRNGRSHLIVLVGPTGSGKTTTLAKLAANWRLNEGLKVGLITTDTYRVAAVDQTKEYATLLGLDLKIAFSAGEASRAVEYFSDRDVVLIDTPGRNYHDRVAMAGLKGILQSMGPVTVLLLVPATLDRYNVSELLGSFQLLEPDYLVIAKIDEARRFSVLTTVACDTTCPIAFVTNGQRVPQDIRPARLTEIADLITRGMVTTQVHCSRVHGSRLESDED